jgi:hypothetical protein
MRRRDNLFAMTLLLLFSISNPADAATVGFRPAVTYPVGTDPRAVSVGDFNGDGTMDLAVANHGDPGSGDDGGLSILLGNGDGTFQAQSSVVVGPNPCPTPICLFAADYNGDGKLDLAVLKASDTLSVLLGNGDGTFQPHTDYATHSRSTQLTLGDLNDDQEPDLIVLQAGGGTDDGLVGILLSNGDGTFQNRIDYSTGSNPTGLAVLDVNSDGELDLVMTVGGLGIETLFGNGDGTFQPGVYCSCGAQGSLSDGVTIFEPTEGTDFDEDGKTDLAVMFFDSRDYNHPRSWESVLLGSGDGTFGPIPVFGAKSPYLFAAITDLNRDGHSDLAIAVSSLTASFGDGHGAFQSISFNAGLGVTTSIAAADINGDNFPDVIVTNYGPWISVLLNTAQPVAVLNLTLSGNGSGTVTSNPAGISCPDGGWCSAPFDMGTAVSLTATASPGSTFTGWSGACSGTGACTITMNTDQNVTANFITPDFSVSATALAPASVVAGQSAASTVSITSVSGFNSAVQFACSVEPAPALGPACSLNPSTATPAANGSASSTLTINTTAPTIALVAPAARAWLYAIWLPMGGLAWLGISFPSRSARKKMLAPLLFCSLLVAGAVFQVSCGGQTSAEFHPRGGTPPGTYTITVTGTSGSTQHATTATLKVQ